MHKRIYYFDRLRVISAIAVILIHICGIELYAHRISTFAWDMYNILDSISHFAVPLFIMLSGALFLSPEKDITVKSLYTKYIPRIAIAFLTWSVIYAVVSYTGDMVQLAKDIILGHHHMYFLYAIGGLYVAVPILRKICEDDKLIVYFLILSAIFTFILPLISKLPHMSVIAEIAKKMKFNIVLGYSAYFVGGYYLNKIELSKSSRGVLYSLGVLGAVSTVVFTKLFSVQRGVVYSGLYDGFSLNIMLWTVAVFTFAKHNLNKPPKTEVRSRMLAELSKLTFGVYLVHMLVLNAVYSIDVLRGVSSVALCLAIKLLFTAVVSFAISYVLNKIPVLKKFIV